MHATFPLCLRSNRYRMLLLCVSATAGMLDLAATTVNGAVRLQDETLVSLP